MYSSRNFMVSSLCCFMFDLFTFQFLQCLSFVYTNFYNSKAIFFYFTNFKVHLLRKVHQIYEAISTYMFPSTHIFVPLFSQHDMIISKYIFKTVHKNFSHLLNLNSSQPIITPPSLFFHLVISTYELGGCHVKEIKYFALIYKNISSSHKSDTIYIETYKIPNSYVSHQHSIGFKED